MKLFAVALAGGLLVAGAASASTIFYSEDFSGYPLGTLALVHGATGQVAAASGSFHTISTDYSFRDSSKGQNGQFDLDSMYDEGTWTIGTNPNAVHDLWVNQSAADNDPTNPFLMVNGATTNSVPAPTAWESEAFVVGAGTYKYSYDVLNLCCVGGGPNYTPSKLQLLYFAPGDPGTDRTTALTIDSDFFTSQSSNNWQHVAGSFTVAGGTIRLAMRDDATEAGGNDFGIDNVNLASAPEPASWALMILGFGGLGAALRRRRAAFA